MKSHLGCMLLMTTLALLACKKTSADSEGEAPTLGSSAPDEQAGFPLSPITGAEDGTHYVIRLPAGVVPTEQGTKGQEYEDANKSIRITVTSQISEDDLELMETYCHCSPEEKKRVDPGLTTIRGPSKDEGDYIVKHQVKVNDLQFIHVSCQGPKNYKAALLAACGSFKLS